MLVVVSDLHLNDGTSGPSPPPEAFRIFADRLSDLAMRASWRADGRYWPIDRIDLLLLGDILDIIDSRRWLQAAVRPWEDPCSPKMADVVAAIVDATLQQNREALSILRSLYGEGAVVIPAANPSGEPVYGAEGHAVSVRTFYMVGNHDWPLHLRGTRYDLIRQKVAHQAGLANAASAPFPHEPSESDELLQVLRRHRVWARHGDIYDPINFCEERDASSLGDAVVIELLNRFLAELERGPHDELPPATVAGLREIGRIHPALLVPAWIEGLLQRTNVRPAARKQLKRTWDQLVDEFLQLPVVRDQSRGSPFNLADGLEQALKFSKRMSLGWISRTTQWLSRLRGVEADSYYPHALAEEDFRNRRARHIVYGHTHAAETVPLDASYADGYVLQQMYHNAGTWRRVYQRTRSGGGECEFIPVESLNFLAFYSVDERRGRSFETWSGTLAADAPDTAVHRLDAGRAPSSPEQQSASSPKVPLRAPHFPRAVPGSPSTVSGRF